MRNIDIQMNSMLGSEREKTEKIIKQNEKDKSEFSDEIKRLSQNINEETKKLAEIERSIVKHPPWNKPNCGLMIRLIGDADGPCFSPRLRQRQVFL